MKEVAMNRMVSRMVPALAGAQARRIGRIGCAMPLIAGASIAVAGAVSAGLMGVQGATMLLIALVPLYILAVGLNAVAVLAGDPLAELQGSTPTGIRAVQTMRAVLLAVGGAVGGLIMFAPLHLMGVVYGDIGWASAVTPTGGAVVMVLAAYALSAVADSPRGATFCLMLLWVLLALFWDTNLVSVPALQRGVPLAAATAAAACAWFALENPERACRKAVGVR